MSNVLKLTAVMTLMATTVLAQNGRPKQPDVRYVPTPDNVVAAMLEMARVTSEDIVYDLGSGDGRIPIAAAVKYGARGVGIEIEPRLVAEANANALKARVAVGSPLSLRTCSRPTSRRRAWSRCFSCRT
jgi:predicted RNA methylase